MRRLHLLRQTLQGFLLQLRRHPVKGFGNAAGDAGKGVAVAAEGDRIAERMAVDCHALRIVLEPHLPQKIYLCKLVDFCLTTLCRRAILGFVN